MPELAKSNFRVITQFENCEGGPGKGWSHPLNQMSKENLMMMILKQLLGMEMSQIVRLTHPSVDNLIVDSSSSSSSSSSQASADSLK